MCLCIFLEFMLLYSCKHAFVFLCLCFCILVFMHEHKLSYTICFWTLVYNSIVHLCTNAFVFLNSNVISSWMFMPLYSCVYAFVFLCLNKRIQKFMLLYSWVYAFVFLHLCFLFYCLSIVHLCTNAFVFLNTNAFKFLNLCFCILVFMLLYFCV